MMELSERQQQVLDMIVKYRSKWGISPTLREIGDALGIKTLRGVTRHIEVLAAKGAVHVKSGIPRSIVPIQPPGGVKLPRDKLFSIYGEGLARNTRVFTPGGMDITHCVTSIRIDVVPGEPITATLTVLADVDVLVFGDRVTAQHAGGDA